MKKLFPFAKQASKSLVNLIVYIVIFAGIAAVVGFLGGLVNWVPLLGKIVDILIWVIRVYCGLSIIVFILAFLKIIK